MFPHPHDSQGGESRIISEVVIPAHSHPSGGADLSSHGLSMLNVEELLLHRVVSDIFDFIIKQVIENKADDC
jgi:hypothetical protein